VFTSSITSQLHTLHGKYLGASSEQHANCIQMPSEDCRKKSSNAGFLSMIYFGSRLDQNIDCVYVSTVCCMKQWRPALDILSINIHAILYQFPDGDQIVSFRGANQTVIF